MMKSILSRRGLITLSGLFGLLMLFSACSKNDARIDTPVAGLMVFNLVPDQERIGVALSGDLLPGGSLPYTSFTGRYINIFPGTRVIESFSVATNSTLDSVPYSFDQSRYYSVFVTGANGVYKNIITEDNYDSLTASSGKAYVRFVHAIPDSSVASVSIAAPGAEAISRTASYGDISEFLAVSPGQLEVGISNEGSVNASRTISVAQSKAYTILMMGLPNGQDTTRAVQIRFVENGTVTD